MALWPSLTDAHTMAANAFYTGMRVRLLINFDEDTPHITMQFSIMNPPGAHWLVALCDRLYKPHLHYE